jgi:hypothetical protein
MIVSSIIATIAAVLLGGLSVVFACVIAVVLIRDLEPFTCYGKPISGELTLLMLIATIFALSGSVAIVEALWF